MDGVLNVLKPPGMTSHDVVDALRRITGQRRVGHAGTLDPGAAGVLVLLIGGATRVSEFLMEADKGYRVEVTFGVATSSGDRFGDVTATADASGLSAEAVRAMLPRFVGSIQQVPPLTSAIKIEGRRLYERARKGETIAVPPRTVVIHQLELRKFVGGSLPVAILDVECGKGTYVRALARDLGKALDVGAHASFMLRRRVGRFTLAGSLTLEALRGRWEDGTFEGALLPIDDALADLPVVDLAAGQGQQLLDGIPLPLFKVPGWEQLPRDAPIRIRDRWGLLALARVEAGRLRPFKVLRRNRDGADAPRPVP